MHSQSRKSQLSRKPRFSNCSNAPPPATQVWPYKPSHAALTRMRQVAIQADRKSEYPCRRRSGSTYTARPPSLPPLVTLRSTVRVVVRGHDDPFQDKKPSTKASSLCARFLPRRALLSKPLASAPGSSVRGCAAPRPAGSLRLACDSPAFPPRLCFGME